VIGNYALAYLLAKSHGFDEKAEIIREQFEGEIEFDMSDAKALLPPSPVALGLDWPRLQLNRGYFDNATPEELAEPPRTLAQEPAEGAVTSFQTAI
jgi:hypothetical protein